MVDKKFKYRARFTDCVVKASVHSEVDQFLSKASLEDLKRLDIGSVVDLEKNIDLVGTIFNAAVINRLNKNDEGISTETAIAIRDLFVHKPHNLEHKTARIVGHIVKAGWSTFGDNKMLTDEEVKNMTAPFNLVLGGVVYASVDEAFADLLIESSDESSGKYNLISTSWEVAFTKYHLVIGSKNVQEAEIISDPEKIEELSKYLRCKKGPGTLPDGRFIGRLIVGGVGDVLPLGMAFTSKPAAEVQGVITSQWEGDSEEDENNQEQVEDSIKSEESIDFATQKNENNSSQTLETVVKNNNQENITMKLKDIKDLIAAASSKEGLSEASVQEFIQTQLESKLKEYEEKEGAKDNSIKEAVAKASTLEADLAKANARIAEMETALSNIQKDSQAKQKQETYNVRMSAISNEFELSDKESKIVASEILNLDDAAYTAWFDKFSVFADSKKKTSIAAQKDSLKTQVEEEVAKKLSTMQTSVASVTTTTTPAKTEEVVTAALDSVVEKPNQSVPNASTPDKVIDFNKEWKDAFGGDNLKITR